MKCWDAYCDAFPQMAETALDDLLGKAFLQAYEDQLIKLKNNR
jgi:predicted component of type VI protein secretion system